MESTEMPSGFFEEIDFNEINFLEVVGRGAFGMVRRARWRGKDVAVKLIETESEKKAFRTELKQLSRVCHFNIVQLYGACTKQQVCLVMEYAEGGSLYNVLHGTGPLPQYTAAHAMSWALQCAKGVEYLHSMKPRPLIHRDLKPPNLLLMNGGTVLKICDFGTACDAHTHMTNNKGSAAWMAPEVFEGSNYSEKCDVFSFGIILWEVLTRKKPFDEIGGPAFRIMWAVHNGTRPPLIKNCPKPMEILMTRCWHANPVERPSIFEVARIMTHLCRFFPGADQPLRYPATEAHDPASSSVYDTPPATNQSINTGSYSRGGTISETVRMVGTRVPIDTPPTPKAGPVVVEDNTENWRRTSAPASLAASRESLLDKSSRSSTPSIDVVNKRYSADLSKLEEWEIMSAGGQVTGPKPPVVRGHRRTGSHGTAFVSATPSQLYGPNLPPGAPTGRGHRRTSSYGTATIVTEADMGTNSSMHHSTTAPGNLDAGQGSGPQRSVSWNTEVATDIPTTNMNLNLYSTPGSSNSQTAALNTAFTLEHQLMPLAPCPTCPESMRIYEEHCRLAQEYLRVQTETALLSQRKHELTQELRQDESDQQNSNRFMHEYQQLLNENESLTLLHKNLKTQVDMLKNQRPNPYQQRGTRAS